MAEKQIITGVLDSGRDGGDVRVVQKAFENAFNKRGGVPINGLDGEVMGIVRRVYIDEATGYLMGDIEISPDADPDEVLMLVSGLVPHKATAKKPKRK